MTTSQAERTTQAQTATFPDTRHVGLPSGKGHFSVTKEGIVLIFPESSAIEYIQYLPAFQTLVVKYISGQPYFYREVPETVVFHLLVASSFGKFINTHIKPNHSFFQ
jgi:hypothetical protein